MIKNKLSLAFAILISTHATSETITLNEVPNPHIKIVSNDDEKNFYDEKVSSFPWTIDDHISLPYTQNGVTVTLYDPVTGNTDSTSVTKASLSDPDGIHIIHTGEIFTSHFTSFPVIKNGHVTLYDPDSGDYVYETETDINGEWSIPIHELDRYEKEHILIDTRGGIASLTYNDGASKIQAARDEDVPLYAHVRTSSLLRGSVTVSLPTHIAYTAMIPQKEILFSNDWENILNSNMKGLTATGTQYSGRYNEEALYLSEEGDRKSDLNYLFLAEEIPIKQYAGTCESLFLTVVNCSSFDEVTNLYRARFDEFIYGLTDIPDVELTKKKVTINVFGNGEVTSPLTIIPKETESPLWKKYETEFTDIDQIVTIKVALEDGYRLVKWDNCESVATSCSFRMGMVDTINITVEPEVTIDNTLQLNEFDIVVEEDFSVTATLFGEPSSAAEKILKLEPGMPFKTNRDEYFIVDQIEKGEDGELFYLSVMRPDQLYPGQELSDLESGRVKQSKNITNKDFFEQLLPDETYQPNVAIPIGGGNYFVPSEYFYSKSLGIYQSGNPENCLELPIKIFVFNESEITICKTENRELVQEIESFFDDGNGFRRERRVSSLSANMKFEHGYVIEKSFNIIGNKVAGAGPFMKASINGSFGASISAITETTRYYSGNGHLKDSSLYFSAKTGSGTGVFDSQFNISGEGGIQAFVNFYVASGIAAAKVRFDFKSEKLNNFAEFLPPECASRDILTATGLLSIDINVLSKSVGTDRPIFVKNLYASDVAEHCKIKFDVSFLGDDFHVENPTSNSTVQYVVTNEENAPIEVRANIKRDQASSFTLTGPKKINLNKGQSHTFTVHFDALKFNEKNIPQIESSIRFYAKQIGGYGVEGKKSDEQSFKLSAAKTSDSDFRWLTLRFIGKMTSPGNFSYKLAPISKYCGVYQPLKDGSNCEYHLNPDKWKILFQTSRKVKGQSVAIESPVLTIGEHFTQNFNGSEIPLSGKYRAWAVPVNINTPTETMYENTGFNEVTRPKASFSIYKSCEQSDLAGSIRLSKHLKGSPNFEGAYTWYSNGHRQSQVGIYPGISNFGDTWLWGNYTWEHNSGYNRNRSGGASFNFVDNYERQCQSHVEGPFFYY